MFDKDGSGSIDRCEIRNAMYILGMSPTEEEVTNMMAELDVNGEIV